MSKYDLRLYEKISGRQACIVATYPLENELELVEKGIELFKKTGGEVGYKVPEDGEKFISDITGKLLDSGDIHNPPFSRLTFTPPKPEPVESEWNKLRGEMRELLTAPDTSAHAKHMLRLMEELDRRCPAGGGKDDQS